VDNLLVMLIFLGRTMIPMCLCGSKKMDSLEENLSLTDMQSYKAGVICVPNFFISFPDPNLPLHNNKFDRRVL
jgi:hypothetical protein